MPATDPPAKRCPNCSTGCAHDESNPWRPFCSERCQQIDLARWLDGDYVIPGPPADAYDIQVSRDPDNN